MLLFILILIPIISATYSGESETIDLPGQFDYYSIVGNSTPVDLIITQEGLIATITFNKYQQSDNFTIIFFNKEKEIIKETETIYRGGGGGGGSIKYVDRNVTIEVPKFYDRNITEIVEREILIEKIVHEEHSPLWFYVSLFVIFLWIIIGILYIRSRSTKTNERGYEYE